MWGNFIFGFQYYGRNFPFIPSSFPPPRLHTWIVTHVSATETAFIASMRVTDSAAAVARLQDILLAIGHIDVPAAAAADAAVSCGQKERLDKSGRATAPSENESEASFSIFHLESSSFHLRYKYNLLM